jgi:hypothetical protein
MGSKEMRVKLMVGTPTNETQTLVTIETVKKGSTRIKMNQQAIIVMTKMMKKSLVKSTIR